MRKDIEKAKKFNKIKGNGADKLLHGRLEGLQSVPIEQIQRVIQKLHIHQSEPEIHTNGYPGIRENPKDSQQKFFVLYDLVPFGYFTFDQNGLILEANITGADLLGVDRRDLIEMGFSHYIMQGFHDRFYLHLKEVSESMKKRTCELKLVRIDGTEFYAQLVSIAFKDINGDLSLIHTVVTDITELKEAEQVLKENKLKPEKEKTQEHLMGILNSGTEISGCKGVQEFIIESEKNLDSISPSMDVNISIIDKDLNIVWADSHAEKIFGPDIVGKKCYEICQKRDEPCSSDSCVTIEAFKDGMIHENDIKVRDKNGELRYFNCHLNNRLLDLNRHACEMLGYSYDQGIKCAYKGLNRIFNVAVPFCVIDKDHNMHWVNDTFCSYFGVKMDEALREKCYKILQGPFCFTPECPLRKIVSGNKCSGLEITKRLVDGRDISCIVTASPYRDLDGNIIGIIENFTDFAELKRTREQLRIQREFADSVINALTDTFYIFNPENGKAVRWNKVLEKISGYTHETINNKPFIHFYPQQEHQRIKDAIDTILKIGHTTFGLTFITRDGRYIPFEYSGVLIRGSEGEPLICVIGRDITTHKRAKEEIIATNARLEHLLKYSPSVIYSLKFDEGYPLTYVSENVKEQLGYSNKEIIDNPKSIISQIHPEDVFRIFTSFPKLLKEGNLTNEYRFFSKNGVYLWRRDQLRLIRDEEGNPLEIVGSSIDITDHKSLEEQLFQSQKMEAVGLLAGGIAHDFNNLLQTITGYSELLLQSYGLNDLHRQDIEQILCAGEKAASLTKQLLTFSRRQIIQPRILDINKVVSDIEKLLKRLIGEDIKLMTILEPNINCIKVDQSQIEHVILNLAVNARDAMPEGGSFIIKTQNVTVATDYYPKHFEARPGEFVCLSLEDTGVGMEKEVMNHIFEPFFTTKGSGRGTGLGLSTVYGIIKQHKGWINVYSEPGKGSLFKIFLPVFYTKPKDEIKGTVSLQDFQGKGERILLVEDDETVREFAARALRENGYTIFDVSCAEEAKDIFEEEKGEFDLILSDVVLPDTSGLRLVEQLLKDNSGLKVLLSSGYSNHQSKWPVIQKKGYAFIHKPYNLVDMLRALKEVLLQINV